ncbi:hypothetical protein F66182_2205 [Fusarium sp. NRRL 66182]|nr:hypothetical protein F66182_2205 [Fusarium sp. NRRL 66182]
MPLRTALVSGLLYAGLASAQLSYARNQVALVKDSDEAARHFPDVEGVELNSPAFTNPKSVPSRFDNGTSGPTDDATLDYFLQSLASRNDWLTYTNPSFKSDEGRSIPYVFLSASSQLTTTSNSSAPQKLRVYLQGGVHGNEPGGDQALLALLGKFDANSTWTASILDKMDIMILPRYNPDGVAFFQRFLATGFDPNRDHIRFTSQQTRDVKQLITDFSPHIGVDCHEYSANRAYGANEQWAQAVDGQFDAMKNLNIHKDIRDYSEKIFAPRIAGALESRNLRWSPYVTGNLKEEPLIFTQLNTEARAGDVSLALTQTMVFLTETRGIMLGSQQFQRRVASGLTMVEAIVQTAADKAGEVYDVVEGARSKVVEDNDDIVISDIPQPTNRTWDMIELETGKLIKVPVQFLSTTPVKANLTRSRPEAYVFPQAWKEAAERLRLVGVKVDTLRSEFRGQVEAFNITSSTLSGTLYQGTVLNTVTTETIRKEMTMPAGSFWVSTRQSAAAYAFITLEPESIDSYATFNILPVSKGDEWNPDPHVIRVDDTYYVAVSSFITYPGIPIYKSKDLANWELVSHAIDSPEKVPIAGVRTDNGKLVIQRNAKPLTTGLSGIWAPSITYINGLFYVTSMAMVGSDPDYKSYPRIFWVSSPDLKTWSDVVWSDPYGIDPHLFHDPVSKKSYLSLMGLNNGYDRLWGITQCQVDLDTGACVGPYRNIWNGTLPVTNKTRPEGPKLFYKDEFYYLLIAEGGTGVTHRATIGRSRSPEGPWESSPTNPLLYSPPELELTVGNTGHATFANTPDGEWFATFLARRHVGKSSVLGRETFFAPVSWEDGWPTVNNGEHVLLSQSYAHGPDLEYPPEPYKDNFEGADLRPSWYQLRSPYTTNYRLKAGGKGLVLRPNVFTLSDRDTPSAILRKQQSLNMTFTATLLPISKGLGPYQSVGISAYSKESDHQDIGVRGCAHSPGLCIFVDGTVEAPGPGIPPQSSEFPLNMTQITTSLKLHIRATPNAYSLGYSLSEGSTKWVKTFSPRLLPVNFAGVMFALFASGNTLPWPYDAPEVGFRGIREDYYDEGLGDYKNETAST